MPRTRTQASLAILAALALAALLPSALAAQSLPALDPPLPSRLGLLDGALAIGAVGALLLIDEPVTRALAADHDPLIDTGAAVTRRMGQPEVWATVGLGLTAVGLVSGNGRLTGAGVRATSSVALAGLATHGLKAVFGRLRPDSLDADHFSPFSSGHSFPSGHATVAFALATSLSDEIRRPWASVLLYGAATGTALSRVHDRRHWLSDVALGAAIGVTTAKFVNGRWSVLGIRAPNFLVTAGGVGAGWSFEH
jgi:membrane-associated phospholipid phosphatase